jgi:anti-sigma B factor antagonist
VRVNRREESGVVILDVEGKILGGEDSQSLRGEIDQVIDSNGPSLLLNLKDVPWMNSSGLGIVLAGYIRMKDYGGDLKLVHIHERVRGILVTTKIIDILEVFEDEEKAIESFAGEGSGEPQRS